MRILIISLLLAGCQIEAKRTGLLYDKPTADVIERGEVDTGRLQSADADIYQPTFRVLDVCCGRTKLIAQDPLTHHYRVVGP